MKLHILPDLCLRFAALDHRHKDAVRFDAWINGHIQGSFDHCLDGPPKLCNSWGYTRDRLCENASSDPDCVVELAGASMCEEHLADVVYKD